MAEVLIFPTTVSRYRWLRREGLRIAAAVNGASIANVRRSIEAEHTRAGQSGAAAEADVAAAIAFVESVRDAADRLGQVPPPSRRDGGAA